MGEISRSGRYERMDTKNNPESNCEYLSILRGYDWENIKKQGIALVYVDGLIQHRIASNSFIP